MCTHVGGPQAHDSYSNRRPSRCVKQDRLTKRCQWTLESRTARCFIQRAKERTHYMKIGVVFSCHQLSSIEFSCHVDPFENFHCHQVAEVPWTPWKFSCPRHMTCKGRLVDCFKWKKEHIWSHMITYAGRSRFGLGSLVDIFLIVFVQSFSTQEHCPFVAAFFSSSSPLSQTPELVARKIHDFQWPCCTIFYPVVMSCHDNSGWLDDIGRISTRVYVYVFVYQALLQRKWLSIFTEALTEQKLAMSFPTIRYVICQAVGSETKLHTHAILMPYATLWDTESDTLADCVGCWVWSLWVGWSAPSSGDDDFFPLCVLARSDLGSVRCSSENDQWDGFSMWDPNDVSQPTITRGAFQSKQGGCRLQGSCMNLRCEWRLNTWPSDLSYSCSHAWSFFAQLLPPQFLWSSLWSLLSLLEQSSSLCCKFEPILNPSIHQPDVFFPFGAACGILFALGHFLYLILQVGHFLFAHLCPLLAWRTAILGGLRSEGVASMVG